jgi:soluble lytic murein transglycosylase
MRDRCLVHAAVANEELGRWEAAAALYEQVPESSRLYSDSRFGLARARKRRGDLPGAIEAITPIALRPPTGLGRDIGAEALLALADLHRDRKDTEAEREALRQLWSGHPLSPLASQAFKRLHQATPSVEAQVTRAEQLIDSNRNAQGLKVLKAVLPKLKLPEPLACRGHFAYGKALRKERKHTLAIESLVPVVDKCKEPNLRVRAMYILGSSRSIVAMADGTKTYEQLAADFPQHTLADDALSYAADLHVKNGDLDKALDRLVQLAKLYPNGDFLGESLFKTFWIYRERKQAPAAMATLDEIEQRFKEGDPYELERGRYWRARMLEETGEKEKSLDVFEALAVEHPATYYGLMSRVRIHQNDEARGRRLAAMLDFSQPTASPWPLDAGLMADDPHFLAGVELLRLGFPEAASPELVSVTRSGLSAEAIRLLVQLLSLTGDAKNAHAIARVALRKDLSGRITPHTRPIWEVAYPNAFRELIEKHCRDAQVEPDLLQALMREESALDPKALSWAGALGLTQLMLPTARGVAKTLKLKRVTAAMLLEPELNIRIGSSYLGTLLRQWSGNKAYALASYNAGASAVRRWREQYPSQELDEWVENIPIAETRGYVKRVLRSYTTYQLLYGRGASLQAVSAALRY